MQLVGIARSATVTGYVLVLNYASWLWLAHVQLGVALHASANQTGSSTMVHHFIATVSVLQIKL